VTVLLSYHGVPSHSLQLINKGNLHEQNWKKIGYYTRVTQNGREF